MKSMKCVIVGDGEVGKTSLLMTYATEKFPSEYVPTVFDNFSKNIMVDDQVINLGLWDTAGQEDFNQFRPISYQSTDLFILCFSTVNPISFYNIRSLWCPEIGNFSAKIPKILVGTKVDLRNDPPTVIQLQKRNTKPIYKVNGEKLAKDIGAVKYMECSALHQRGVDEIFEEAKRIILRQRKKRMKKNKSCQIL